MTHSVKKRDTEICMDTQQVHVRLAMLEEE